MKISTRIRFILAATFSTLACVGLLAHVFGSAVFFSLSWLLLMGRAELTRPIPRSEQWMTFVIIGISLVLLLTLPFLHLPATDYAETHGMAHFAFVSAFWILCLGAIYHRWQKEKGKVYASYNGG